MMDSNVALPSLPRRLARLGARLLSLALFAILVFGAGFALFGMHVGGMRMPATVEPADGIIALTGGSQRLTAAVTLLKTGKGRRLLISGVNPVADRSDLQRATGGDPALFACCVDIDYAALDTIGNAEESAKWLRDRGYASVIVVTSNYHIPRSLMEIRRVAEQSRVIPYPVVNTEFGRFGWMARPDIARVLFIEYVKFAGAAVRNLIAGAPVLEGRASMANPN